MKAKWLFTTFSVLGFLLVLQDLPTYAQKPAKTLSLLYSNNINGEIDPCPT